MVKKEGNMKKNRKGSSLDKLVDAVIISEYPVDSMIANTEQMKKAKAGLLNYIQTTKPDVIFVDGLFSRIRYPEAYIDGLLESEPLLNMMDEPFNLGANFLSELRKASPKSEIHYVLSDADEDNIRRLTKYNALSEAKSAKAEFEGYNDEIKRLKNLIKEAKKEKKPVKKIEKSLKKIKKEMVRFAENNAFIDLDSGDIRMPREESPEWVALKEDTTNAYVEKLQELNKNINFHKGTVQLTMKGFKFYYAHNGHIASDVPLASRTNKILESLNKQQMGNLELPDFILESGHHGEPMVHPYRHASKEGQEKIPDEYSLVATGMVMEDQKIVKDILDKKFKPDRFQGKQKKLEAVKRHLKKLPAAGIMHVGKSKDGYFAYGVSVRFLANLNKSSVKLTDLKYEELTILSDMHIGKGEVRYDALKAAFKKIESEIDERVKRNESAPILIVPNESLQGANYKTMRVETKRSIPEDLELEMVKKANELKRKGAKLDDIVNELVGKAIHELNRTNEPRIENQWERYLMLTNRIVLKTLLYSQYDIAAIFNEATHIKHTVGHEGITEVGLQAIPYRVLQESLKVMEEEGLIKIKNEQYKQLYDKIKCCEYGLSGYERFPITIGEKKYIIAAEHKPGSAKPSSNIPLKQIKRAINMCDNADIHVSAHLHTPFCFFIGKQASNTISAFYKGATFNEYDSYGREGGWSPAVIGYEKAFVPKNADGIYGVKFILSDVLSKKN